jgi:hypothetical protein
MKNLKRLGLSFTLIAVLFTAAFAGETEAPPCATGQTEAPPCTTQSVNNDSTDPGETQTPPSGSVDIVAVAEATFWALALF